MKKAQKLFYSSGPPTKTASKSCLYLGHLCKHVKENNVPGDIRLFPETKIFRPVPFLCVLKDAFSCDRNCQEKDDGWQVNLKSFSSEVRRRLKNDHGSDM